MDDTTFSLLQTQEIKTQNSSSTRFAEVSDDMMEEMNKKKRRKSTESSTKTQTNILKNYLKEINHPKASDLESFEKQELAETLKRFYIAARKSDGHLYKLTAFRAIKYGLARFFEEKKNFDIVNDVEFKEANIIYGRMEEKLKECGKGKVDHYEEIEPEDLLKLYKGFNIETADGLQDKVWFDLCLQLCRRGRENLRTMTKSTFAVGVDATGREFVDMAVDEADKNHSSSDSPFDTPGEGALYAVPGHPLCPVATFKKYTSLLNPVENALWQRPKLHVTENDSVWYCNSPLGAKALGDMMSNLSQRYKLSRRYTNHCVRVTSIQLLDDENVPGRHIVRISGHKSEASIKTYARKLSSARKRSISDTFNKATGICARETTNQNRLPLKAVNTPRPVPVTVPSFSSSESSSLPLVNINDLDLDNFLSNSQEIIEEIEQNINSLPVLPVTIQQQLQQSQFPACFSFPSTSQTSMIPSTFNFMPNLSNCQVTFNICNKSA